MALGILACGLSALMAGKFFDSLLTVTSHPYLSFHSMRIVRAGNEDPRSLSAYCFLILSTKSLTWGRSSVDGFM